MRKEGPRARNAKEARSTECYAVDGCMRRRPTTDRTQASEPTGLLACKRANHGIRRREYSRYHSVAVPRTAKRSPHHIVVNARTRVKQTNIIAFARDVRSWREAGLSTPYRIVQETRPLGFRDNSSLSATEKYSILWAPAEEERVSGR